MKVSVAMATYNGARYLAEQLESIRRQTRPVDEVVICDDGSADDTAALVRRYIEVHGLGGTWTFCQNPQNLGYAANFIAALCKTSGDIVFFCDQDDRWTPRRVEQMAGLMERREEILLLCSEFSAFADGAKPPRVPQSILARFRNDGALEKLELNKKTIFIGAEGCGMCVRRSFFDRVEPYWFEGWAHDEFVWKAALCLGGCYYYHRVTLERRLHGANVTMRKMRDRAGRVRFLRALCRSHEATLLLARDAGLPEESIRLIRRNIAAARLRIDLLENRRLSAALLLAARYGDCYHSRKSIPVELMMAFGK